MNAQWLLRPRADPRAELRLFCMPYAGGAASIYRKWSQVFPRQIEVCAVELPGRGSRVQEAPFVRMAPLVKSLANAIEPFLDRPFALFGHSLGGLVAFELTRWLRWRGGAQPRHLFISATSAPGAPLSRPLIHAASDLDVKKKLRCLNGTPREFLENDELMELMVPIIRADFSVLETYQYREEPPLAVPISVFGGILDRTVKPSSLEGWRKQSTMTPRLRMLPGGHFFLHETAAEIAAAISEDLGVGQADQGISHAAREHGVALAGGG